MTFIYCFFLKCFIILSLKSFYQQRKRLFTSQRLKTAYSAVDAPAVVRARVREVRNRGLEPTAVVDVKEVLKSSLVNIPKETHTLYYSSSCLCPPLTIGEEYLIMGYENEERSR